MKQIHILLGSALPVLTGQPSSRDERGLSQSTENAVLLPVSYTHLTLPTILRV